MWLTPELLNEIILPSPIPREKLINGVMYLMQKKPEVYLDWSTLQNCLLKYPTHEEDQQKLRSYMEEQKNKSHTNSDKETPKSEDMSGDVPFKGNLEFIKAGIKINKDIFVAAANDDHEFLQEIVEASIESSPGVQYKDTPYPLVKDLLNIFNENGHTPLMVAVEQQHVNSVLILLVGGANPNLIHLESGNQVLHIAAKLGNEVIVKALLAFEADISHRNRDDQTAIDIATENEESNNVLDILKEMAKAQENAAKVSGSPPELKHASGSFLLSLDGGGVRGIILGKMAEAIEKRMKLIDPNCKPFMKHFDYVAGTSVGGILALAGVYRDFLTPSTGALLLGTADNIFKGDKKDRVDRVKNNLKTLLGEETKLAAQSNPKVLVTTSVVSNNSSSLHLFTNFNEEQQDEKVWEIACATLAAPWYFPPYEFTDKEKKFFIDGGVVANNPTLPATVEIRQKMPDEFSRLQCVISLGTGWVDSSRSRAKDEEAPNVFVTSMIKKFLFPWKIPDAIGNVKHLFNLFVSRATESDGLPVQIAQEWCKSIGYRYHRLSPKLQSAISLDSTERSNIIDMLYTTALYMLEKSDEIDSIAQLLLAHTGADTAH